METSGVLTHHKLTKAFSPAVHYRNLLLYMRLGLVLVRIHRVLEFKQKAWLCEYIDFNTKYV